jgi:hypothetical protein
MWRDVHRTHACTDGQSRSAEPIRVEWTGPSLPRSQIFWVTLHGLHVTLIPCIEKVQLTVEETFRRKPDDASLARERAPRPALAAALAAACTRVRHSAMQCCVPLSNGCAAR